MAKSGEPTPCPASRRANCYMLNACDPDHPMPTDSAGAANVHTRASYEEVSYHAHPLGLAHPEHLAAIARLHGVDAVPLVNCRVLEIGCADAGHLIPMALALPGSEFVGMDFADAAIASGQETARALGLTNLHLDAADLLDSDPGVRKFDYIICHGF